MAGHRLYNDFSHAADLYESKPDYSPVVLDFLVSYALSRHRECNIVDVGAGTGKLTRMLSKRGGTGVALEPNEKMRSVGCGLLGPESRFVWAPGTAEATGLQDMSVDWVCMGGVLHRTRFKETLDECHRILHVGGLLTAIWRLDDLGCDPILDSVEKLISQRFPGARRAHLDTRQFFRILPNALSERTDFNRIIYAEAQHRETMSIARYLQSLKAAHDIPSQFGDEKWMEVISEIGELLQDKQLLSLGYRTFAWTLTRCDY